MDNKITHDADYWVNRPLTDKHLDWDWGENWLEGYAQSVNHPHRQVIVKMLEGIKFGSLLEIGCSCGPNLKLIQERFPGVALAGTDVEPRSIALAQELLPGVRFAVETHHALPFKDKSFDVVLADATLMYVPPVEIDDAFDEVDCIAKKAILIVDRYTDSLAGERNGNVWARDYQTALINRGWNVKKTKLTKAQWPKSIGWQRFGYIFLATK